MNILLLEDNGTVFSFLIEELEKLGHKIELATKISKAIDLMEEFDSKFDCLIVDLHVDPSGLDIKNMNTYNPIWGWGWLEKYVFPKDEKWKKRTIIYSGYTQVLYSKVDKKNYKDVCIIDDKLNFDQINTFIKKIQLDLK